MQIKLLVVQPADQPNEYEVTLPVIIGRGNEAGLKLTHGLVSREHCQLYIDRGRLFVRDLGSLNGTFIGGQRIETAPLPPGELLTVGSVTFRAIYGEEAYLAPSRVITGEVAAGIETVHADDTAQISPQPHEQPLDRPVSTGETSQGGFFRPSNN
jgi:pSer/pThr/pTyr-binding forkhead associated (FHA) protein